VELDEVPEFLFLDAPKISSTETTVS